MSNDHRIERISVVSRATDLVAARAQQTRLSQVLRGPVTRSWSQVMDRYVGADEVIYLDRLELQLPGRSAELPEREIERRLTAALVEQLDQLLLSRTDGESAARKVDTAVWQADRWGDFLVMGQWYDTTGQTDPQRYFSIAVSERSPALLPAWRAAFRRGGPATLDRLLRQLPLSSVAQWLQQQWTESVPAAAFTRAYWRKQTDSAHSAQAAYYAWLRTVATDLASADTEWNWVDGFWKDWLAQSSATSPLPTLSATGDWPRIWQQRARQWGGIAPHEAQSKLRVVNRPPSLTPQETKREADATLEPADHYVSGAGLVLLHPYLPLFFQELELLDSAGKNFRDLPARERALQLCHWLVTGATACAEQDTGLYKLLCAWPAGAVPRTDHELPTEWLEQGTQLLQATVRNWDKLGESSPDALREGFLQRTGKLSRDNMGHVLRVGQRGQDILLEYLPWGIGIVKLPWMPQLLRVEWT